MSKRICMNIKYVALLVFPIAVTATINSQSSAEKLQILGQKFILTAQLCALESTYKDLESIMLTAEAKKTINKNRKQLKNICDKKSKILKKIQELQQQLIKEGRTESEVEEILLQSQQS